MTIAVPAGSSAGAASRQASQGAGSTSAVRALFLLLVCAAFATGFVAVDAGAMSRAVFDAGSDLTRLLRGMAVLKALMAACTSAVVLWRFGLPVRPVWFAAYALSGAAMWSGPGLIWGMTHVGTGALLLHGGLLASILLLWRDPAVAARLATMIAARRALLRPDYAHDVEP